MSEWIIYIDNTRARLIIILKLSTIQVPRRTQFRNLLRTHLLPSRLQRRPVQLANLLQALFIALLLPHEKDWNPQPRTDAQHARTDGGERIGIEFKRDLRDVAREARVSLGYLSEVERGQKEASSELLNAICEALDLTLSSVIANVSLELKSQESAKLSVVDAA